MHACQLLFGALLILWAVPADAQNRFEQSRYNRASYYSYSEPGDVTIKVSAWGSVQNPGLYEIPKGTQLNEFVSLVGGPNISQQSSGRYRKLTIRLVRDKNGKQVTLVKQVMEDAIYTLDKNPELKAGDILTAELYTKDRLTWHDIFPIVSATATVISTALTLRAVAGS